LVFWKLYLLKEVDAMKIQIAGPGCPRCQATEKNVINACSELELPPDICHVYDVEEYAKLGVRITPAVIIDGKIAISGKVPTVEELKKLLSDTE
jgi:small redox-active disulfide protein 2